MLFHAVRYEKLEDDFKISTIGKLFKCTVDKYITETCWIEETGRSSESDQERCENSINTLEKN